MKYILLCDIFGYQYNFLRNGEVIKKTKIGVFLTIIYIIIVIALFLGFGIDLYTRKNPKVSFNSIIQPYIEKNLTNNQFLFAYRIENIHGIEVIDDSIIKLQLMNFKYKLINGNWVIFNFFTDINKIRCSDIPDINLKEQYYNISLKNWYCINFDNQTMGGYWDGDFVNLFTVVAKQCENDTVNNYTCKSYETIIKSSESITSTANFLISFLYMEAMPTLDDYNEPIKSTLVNRYEVLDTKITKKLIHTYKETSVNDNRGWIFSDMEIKSIYASDSILTDFKIKDNKESILFGYYMYFGKRKEIYNRTYIKIQEVIASIGGFSKFFHLIVSIFYGYISKILKNLDLVEIKNNFNHINHRIQKALNQINQNNENNMRVGNNKDISNRTKIEISSRTNIEFIKLNRIEKNMNKNIYQNYRNKKKEIDFNLIIKQKIYCKKNSSFMKEEKMKLILYETINLYHNHILDVITYLNLFKELNLIKKILLDNTQQKALELINNKYLIDEPVNVELFLPKFEEYIIKNSNSEINKRLLVCFEADKL